MKYTPARVKIQAVNQENELFFRGKNEWSFRRIRAAPPNPA
jgi:hypothetical protein